jgi:hypothetical protein
MARAPQAEVAILAPSSGRVRHVCTVTAAFLLAMDIKGEGRGWPTFAPYDDRHPEHRYTVNVSGLFGRKVERPISPGYDLTTAAAAEAAAWARAEAAALSVHADDIAFWLHRCAARLDALAGFDMRRGRRLWRC